MGILGQPARAQPTPGAKHPLAALVNQFALGRAAELARSGRYAEAEQLLREQVDPAASPETLDLVARIHAQQGRLTEAKALWTQALQLEPGSVAYAAALARIARLERQPRWLAPLWRVAKLAVLMGALILAVRYLRPAPTPPPPEPPSLAATVQARLQADGELGPLGLAVSERGSAIYLVGTVPRPEMKTRAETLAKEVAGDRAVDSSGILLQPTQPLPLAQWVEQALAAEPRLAGTHITVEQVASGISVSGTVTEPGLREVVETLAAGVEGVEWVDSRRVVVVEPDLADVVSRALQADPRLTGLAIQVEQVGRGVRLTGIAPSWEAKLAVEAATRAAEGVTLVDGTEIRVEPAPVEYWVRSGDSLAAIARQFYGDETRWPLIYEANRDVLDDPALLYPGTRLVIPGDGP